MVTEESTEKKKVVDYSPLEGEIAALKSEAKGNLEETLEKLLNKEKTQRLGGDAIATEMLCIAIVQVCYEAKNFKLLNEHIILLSKRRSQLKKAIVGMVQESMSYIDKITDIETKTELISTLNTVTAGKIYVEVERARLTRQLAKIKEAAGNVDEAAEIMQEVAVETFGAMAKTEKVAFILEQVRLCLEKKDFIRAAILNKKISPRTFVEKPVKEKKERSTADQEAPPEQPPLEGTPSLDELKLMYYDLSIIIAKEENQYGEVCRCYQAIYADKNVSDDPTRWGPVLKKICWYSVLAPHGTEQQSMLHTINDDKKLQDMPLYAALIKQFITMEVIRWTQFLGTYNTELDEESNIFGGGDVGAKRRKDLQERVVEHNILVICKYYTRITLSRLAQLLDLTNDEAEAHLSKMVVSKTIQAKLDRPAGIVKCKAKMAAPELLNGWFSNIDRVLSLVEQSTHQIHKEAMLHKVSIEG